MQDFELFKAAKSTIPDRAGQVQPGFTSKRGLNGGRGVAPGRPLPPDFANLLCLLSCLIPHSSPACLRLWAFGNPYHRVWVSRTGTRQTLVPKQGGVLFSAHTGILHKGACLYERSISGPAIDSCTISKSQHHRNLPKIKTSSCTTGSRTAPQGQIVNSVEVYWGVKQGSKMQTSAVTLRAEYCDRVWHHEDLSPRDIYVVYDIHTGRGNNMIDTCGNSAGMGCSSNSIQTWVQEMHNNCQGCVSY